MTVRRQSRRVWAAFARAACLFSIALLGVRAQAPVRNSGPRVRVQQGVVAGTRFGVTGGEFLGIPYAAAPVGGLRWVAPQQPAAWAGVRDATYFRPACPQLPSAWLPEMLGRTEMQTSEDCLYLNVWTPRLGAGARLPVMVWTHGGGNVEGSQEWPPLGPALAAHGVVVVTINYRLGVLGYLAHPELSAESAEHVSGNYGLLDQMAALRWVQRNIARFGGDGERVTVFGQSSGSLDVCDLMASPLARGLFQRAIMQSGVCVDGTSPTLKEQETSGAEFAAKVVGDASGAAIAKMRGIPANELVRVADKVGGMDWNPIVDGRVLAVQPAEVFRRGEQAKVPVIVGSNADEVSIFASPLVGGKAYRPQTVSEYHEWLKKKFGGEADAVFRAYPAAQDGDVPAVFVAMDTDYDYGFGSQLLAKEVARSGGKAFLYIFTMRGEGPFAGLGAFHSLECMYLSRHYWRDWVRGSGDEALSDAMIGYWTSFARDGVPDGSGLAKWSAYREKEPEAQELGVHVGAVPVPRGEKMPVFQGVLDEELEKR